MRHQAGGPPGGGQRGGRSPQEGSPAPAFEPSDDAAEILHRLRARPRILDRYRPGEEIARGGMGIVTKVWDRDLHRHLAMKSLRIEGDTVKGERSLARFLEEAQITGQLDHPGIVSIHELGLDEHGRLYFTMQLVRGRTLDRIFELAAEGTEGWSQTRALGAILKVCEAMAYAHDRGVVHRDLKPANVMVGRFGEVFVVDWGLARVLERAQTPTLPSSANQDSAEVTTHRRAIGESSSPLHTMEGDVLGTPAYMAPEQAAGQLEAIDKRSDVYSLGAILYHLLAGHAPYAERDPYAERNRKGSHLDVLHRISVEGPTDVLSSAPGTPPELVAICAKAMARNPAERYAGMLAMREDLQAYLEGRVVQAFEVGAIAELRKWVARNRPLAAAMAGAVLFLVAGLVASLLFHAEAERRAENILSLSALQEIEDLRIRADELWPVEPSREPAFEEWLADARELLSALPKHRERLDALRARALGGEGGGIEDHPDAEELAYQRSRLGQYEEQYAALVARVPAEDRSAEEGLGDLAREIDEIGRTIAVLEARASQRWLYDFETREDRWWHNQLQRLVLGLESLSDARHGLIDGIDWPFGPGIARRLELARDLERSTLSGRESLQRWSEACASIRDPAQCPAYGGLLLEPQFGLIPIGRDPSSGLWEFAHPLTGAIPDRERDGRLAMSGASCLVFVLIPAEEPFFLSKYEMTQGQWLRFAGENPSHYQPGTLFGGSITSLCHPVESMAYDDCVLLLRRMELLVPTEEQWEQAALAGGPGPWWTGETEGSLEGAANVADEYCRDNGGYPGVDYAPWSDGYTIHAPVGSFRANPFGLHDVHGNVAEFCQIRPDAGGVPARGGGFGSTVFTSRATMTLSLQPHTGGHEVGVRPSRSLFSPSAREARTAHPADTE